MAIFQDTPTIENIKEVPKRKPSVRRLSQEAPKEEPAFVGMKLKKSKRVQRTWEDDKMESVELKHHEFEVQPEIEEDERTTGIILTDLIEKKVQEKEKEKKVKKKKKVRQSVHLWLFSDLVFSFLN